MEENCANETKCLENYPTFSSICTIYRRERNHEVEKKYDISRSKKNNRIFYERRDSCQCIPKGSSNQQ